MKKRILSSFLCLCMVIGLLSSVTLPALAYSTGDDYPGKYKNPAQDTVVDEWNFYNRECTSYAAWCLNSRNGISFHNWYGNIRWGHAKDWGNAARSLGIPVDQNPSVGAIAWWNSGTYGHVAWVREVNGNNVTIEEYNAYPNYYAYQSRTISKSAPDGYIHIKDISPSTTSYPTAQQNLGEDFYAYISYPNGNLNLENRGGNVQTAVVNTSDPRQAWHFVRQENGSYEIISVFDGQRMDLSNNTRENEVNIQVWKDNDSTAQRWNIVNDAGGQSGSYNLLPYGENNYSLDVINASTNSGANIHLYKRNATAAQAFKITRIDDIGSILACKVDLLTSPVTGGTVIGGGTYKKGASVTVEAVAYDGCEFVEWRKDGRKVSGNAIYTFTVDADITLTAVFDVPPVTGTIYPITATASPSEGGTVGIATRTSLAESGKSSDEKFAAGGEKATVTAKSNSGYVFTGWQENGSIVSTDASYTFTVGKSRYLTAVFEKEGPTVPVITAWPVASAVRYGQKLSDSTLSGGAASVSGTFQWRDPSVSPRPGQSYGITFIPSDMEKYNCVNGAVYVTVDKAVPKLSVSAHQSGTSVMVTVSAANPYDAALTDIPAPAVICRVGNGEPQTVSGGSFAIPEGTKNGAVITVIASVTGNGFYCAAEKSTTVTVTGIADDTIYHVLTTSGSDLGGAVSIQPVSARQGETVTITVTPRSGYVLRSVTAADASGTQVYLTSLGSGRYTFIMPGSNVTLDAVFDVAQDDWVNPFSDIVEDAWYYEAVKFVSQNGLMNGSNGVFDHSGNLSRAMIAQILYNKEGRPAVAGGQAFRDVSSGTWYSDAVKWASESKLVFGDEKGLFQPDNFITREQLAVILWRYEGCPALSGGTLSFADSNRISSYAREAVSWAVGNGIINGKGGGILDPQGSATRAQVAQILMNYLMK